MLFAKVEDQSKFVGYNYGIETKYCIVINSDQVIDSNSLPFKNYIINNTSLLFVPVYMS